MIRIFLIDDHTVLRQGLRLIVESAEDMEVVGEAGSGQEALERLSRLSPPPDIILLDIHLPDTSGIALAHKFRALFPHARVIILTVSDHTGDLMAAVQAGVRGYLLKNASAEEVLDALRRVHRGEAVLPPSLTTRLLDQLTYPGSLPTDLTERELQILRYIARGLSNKEIASTLNLSENTVKTHVRKILAKLNARSRAEAAALAVRAGLLTE
ncbi:MAG: response regulator transcription factor [Chloroflexi bacterium]|nr:response regulator transcription factor [Chloroflexota bacterium]